MKEKQYAFKFSNDYELIHIPNKRNRTDSIAYYQPLSRSYFKMVELIQDNQIPFPYLYDETQEVAKAYHAACTPDFFFFSASVKGENYLIYRGQMDGSRPGNEIVPSAKDLRAAIKATLNSQLVSKDQKPSIGCNIKWKLGSEPSWFS